MRDNTILSSHVYHILNTRLYVCFCSVQVQVNKMYVASGTHGIVYLINLEGQLLRKCGLKRVRGEEGQFNEPHICHGDLFGSIMIADRQNECLQVRKCDRGFEPGLNQIQNFLQLSTSWG